MAQPVDPEPAAELDALLRDQGDAMHRLARSLATDSAAADDLVQDSALAALRRPAGEIERPGAWFAGTVKRLAARRWRDRERRTRRERENARPEALPSSAELLAQREVLADVMQAIRELDEIYARPLLLLYFHDMSAEEAARALGVPSATVRTRHRRALEKLRQKLDKKHGSRDAWALVLLALEPDGATTAPAAAPASSLGLGWLAAGGLGAVVLVAWWQWPRRVEHEPVAPSAPRALVASADEPPGAALEPSEPRRAVPVDPVEAARRRARAQSSGPVLIGSVRDALGAPVPFAQIRSGERNDDMGGRALAHCDARGEFSLALQPGEPIELRAWQRGYLASDVLRTAVSVAIARPIEFVLPGPAQRVEGRVVDARGAPVAGAWVRVGPEIGNPLDPSDPYGSRASPGPLGQTNAEGRFQLDGIAAGPTRLAASHAASGFSERRIDVPDGVVASFDVALAPLALVRGSVRADDGTPIEGAVVRYEPRAPHLLRSTTSAADGTFELACPPLPGLELTAVYGALERTQRFDLAADDLVEWTIELPPQALAPEPAHPGHACVAIELRDPQDGVVTARVLCLSAGVDRRVGPSTHIVRTLSCVPVGDAWSITGIPPGRYGVWAGVPGLGLFLVGEIEPVEGENRYVLRVPAAGVLRLAVAAPAARASERWSYVIDPRLYGPDLLQGLNAGPAPHEIGLAEGMHVLRVESERGARIEREFEIRAGVATVLELELP